MDYMITSGGIVFCDENGIPMVPACYQPPVIACAFGATVEEPEIPMNKAIEEVEAIAAKQRAALESELIPNG